MKTLALLLFDGGVFATVLSSGWRVCRRSNGESSYATSCSVAEAWDSPALPTTALMALLSRPNVSDLFSGNVPPNASDPYYSTNLAKIVDVNATGRGFWTLRYERQVQAGWLEFGCNYRGRVFIDGHEVGSVDKFGGMFARRRYKIAKPGLLGVVVEPPDHVGAPTGGQGGDHSLAKDVTAQFVLGWDWMAAMPDRSTGFFGPVELTPNIVRDAAILTVELPNKFRAVGRLDEPANVTILVDGRVVGRSTGCIVDTDFEANLSLWYPRDFDGCCLLHEATFDVNGTISETFKFGARKFTSFKHPRTGGRAFAVNGHPFFIVGGNWIATDAAWRYSANYERYRDELALHAEAGLNAIRVWGGGIAETDQFYRAADELGLVVYQEFWMTGDNNGRWAGSYEWPLDRNAFEVAVESTVRRLRRFASLMLLGGGNELYPPQLSPPGFALDVEERQSNESETLFVPSSMDGGISGGNQTLHNDEYALAPKDGPYGMLTPLQFSQRNPGLDPNLEISVMPEIGSCAAPDSKQALSLYIASSDIDDRNSVAWAFHKYEKMTVEEDTNITYDFVAAYGFSSQDWLIGAKLAMHQQAQLLFESYSAHIFDWYAAVFYWKTQSPWPALRGFLYDWYLLQPNGNWRGAKTANALHRLQYDYARQRIVAVNRHPTRAWSLKGELTYEWIDVEERISSSRAVPIKNMLPPLSSATIVDRLEVPNRTTQLLSINHPNGAVYWVSDVDPPDYSALGACCDSVRLAAFEAVCIDEANNTRVDVDIRVDSESDLLFYPQVSLKYSRRPNSWEPPVFARGDSSLIIRPGTLSRRVLFLAPPDLRGTANFTSRPRCGDMSAVVLDAVNLPGPIQRRFP